MPPKAEIKSPTPDDTRTPEQAERIVRNQRRARERWIYNQAISGKSPSSIQIPGASLLPGDEGAEVYEAAAVVRRFATEAGYARAELRKAGNAVAEGRAWDVKEAADAKRAGTEPPPEHQHEEEARAKIEELQRDVEVAEAAAWDAAAELKAKQRQHKFACSEHRRHERNQKLGRVRDLLQEAAAVSGELTMLAAMDAWFDDPRKLNTRGTSALDNGVRAARDACFMTMRGIAQTMEVTENIEKATAEAEEARQRRMRGEQGVFGSEYNPGLANREEQRALEAKVAAGEQLSEADQRWLWRLQHAEMYGGTVTRAAAGTR